MFPISTQHNVQHDNEPVIGLANINVKHTQLTENLNILKQFSTLLCSWSTLLNIYPRPSTARIAADRTRDLLARWSIRSEANLQLMNRRPGSRADDEFSVFRNLFLNLPLFLLSA